MSQCLTCGSEVDVDSDAEEGEIVECAECGAELEIVNLDPIEFAHAPEEEDDWGE